MLNRAVNSFADDAGRDADSGRWETDRHPTRRLIMLFAAFALPMLAVVGRLYVLQGVMSLDFFDPPDATTVTHEWIPARDGRILSADGQVLAEDVVRYEIHAHYRWLETPPNPGWLRRRAFARLGKSDRRNRELVEAEERQVLVERDRMWQRLKQLIPRDAERIAKERSRIQRRVEHMLETVSRRIEQRRESRQQDRDYEQDDAELTSARGIWRTVVDELTTPPHRSRREPLVLPEQSDYHRLLDDVVPAIAAEIEANPELYPGLRVRFTTRRRYPQKSLAAHLIGYRLREPPTTADGIPVDDVPGKPTLPPRTRTVGKTGIEKSYDATLCGRPGIRRVIRNSRGEVLRTEILHPPRAGRDVVLSLDVALQRRLEDLLDRRLRLSRPAKTTSPPDPFNPPSGGCLVALDVHTGSILAAASAPRFDLNLFVNHDPDEWRKLNADPRRPFFPRAVAMALPPGSVFKAVSAVAALESGAIDPAAKLHCQGYLDRPNRNRCLVYRRFGVGHGDMDFSDAICRSCNVYFYTAARKLGPRPFTDWAQRFGLGEPTGVDLPGEKPGRVPNPLSRKRRPWYPGDTLGMAIGQSRLTTTPLQIARMMAAVANDGKLVTPHLLRRIGTAGRVGVHASAWPAAGSTAVARTTGQAEAWTPTPIPGLSGPTLSRVREGLRKVVQDRHGTGYKYARLPEIEFAGKTGTAEVGGNRPDHAWFAGYAPANNPRVAFAVVLEHAGSGGREAGPVAKQLVQSLLQTGFIRSRLTVQRDASPGRR
jgi:penicillin-binding protein 2